MVSGSTNVVAKAVMILLIYTLPQIIHAEESMIQAQINPFKITGGRAFGPVQQNHSSRATNIRRGKIIYPLNKENPYEGSYFIKKLFLLENW